MSVGNAFPLAIHAAQKVGKPLRRLKNVISKGSAAQYRPVLFFDSFVFEFVNQTVAAAIFPLTPKGFLRTSLMWIKGRITLKWLKFQKF